MYRRSGVNHPSIRFYGEVPIKIFDREVKKLVNKEVVFKKVLWKNYLVDGAIWEAEADIKSHYPHIFPLTQIQG